MGKLEDTNEREYSEYNQVEMSVKFKQFINEFWDVLRQELPDELPLSIVFGFEIKTDLTQAPSWRPVIRLSWAEE